MSDINPSDIEVTPASKDGVLMFVRLRTRNVSDYCTRMLRHTGGGTWRVVTHDGLMYASKPMPLFDAAMFAITQGGDDTFQDGR